MQATDLTIWRNDTGANSILSMVVWDIDQMSNTKNNIKGVTWMAKTTASDYTNVSEMVNL